MSEKIMTRGIISLAFLLCGIGTFGVDYIWPTAKLYPFWFPFIVAALVWSFLDIAIFIIAKSIRALKGET